MRKGKWIRWLGVVAALAVLTFFVLSRDFRRFFTGSQVDEVDVLLYLALVLLPALAAVFLSAFARFWWTFSLGVWILFFSVPFCIEEKASPTALALVLAAVIICITPFLNRACRPIGSGTNEDTESGSRGFFSPSSHTT